MTLAQITAYSSQIEHQYQKLILDYPMDSYIPFWKIFRSFSNENKIIANAVNRTTSWRARKDSIIIDLGGGDGLVLNELLKKDKPNNYKENVIFVEPNTELLSEARVNLIRYDNVQYSNITLEDFRESNIPFAKTSLSLAIHLLYLVDSGSLSTYVKALPKGSKLIIVTDSKKSLFTDCWNISAHKFYKRSTSLHTEINDLALNGVVSVIKNEFRTYLKNPFTISRKDLKYSLLSMITYSSFEQLPIQMQNRIKSIFLSYSRNDLIECKSTCYQLEKL